MAMTSPKNGRAHVLEISNRATVQKLATEDLTGITASINNHYSGLNTNAHQIGNIAGLQDALDSKQDAVVGYNGILNVVTSVNFIGGTVTTAEITIENGVIVNVS